MRLTHVKWTVVDVDNFILDVQGHVGLQKAVELCFDNQWGTPAKAFKIDSGRLSFGWSPDADGWTPLPAPANPESVARTAIDWLKMQDYGQPDDFDGSDIKGWRVQSRGWNRYEIVSIAPAWMEAHK